MRTRLGSFIGVPIDRKSVVYTYEAIIGVPIYRYTYEGVGEVVGVGLLYVFDTEVIYYEGECDGAGDMSPQAGRVCDFKISVGARCSLRAVFASFPACGKL